MTFYKTFCKFEEIVVGTLFVSIVALVFSAAFFRQFGRPIVWADDVAKLLFSWAAFLGADVAMRYSRLVGLDFLVKKLPRKVAKIVQIFVFLIIIMLLASFVVYGVKLTIDGLDRSFQTLSNVSYSYVTASLPVSSALMIITASTKIQKIIKNFQNDEYEVLKDTPMSNEEGAV